MLSYAKTDDVSLMLTLKNLGGLSKNYRTMKKMLFFSFLLLALFSRANAQSEQPAARVLPPDAATLAATITGEELYRHLVILASDEYQGRETGTPGQEKAADYIAAYFQELGLPAIGEQDSYFQQIHFRRGRWASVELSVAGADAEAARHLRDFYAYPATNPGGVTLNKDEMLFLGYGIDDPAYSDYGNRKVDGRVLLIYAGEPFDVDGRSRITGTEEASAWSADWRRKVITAQEKGAAAVFIIDDQFRDNLGQARRDILNNSLQMVRDENPIAIPNLFLSSTLARLLMGDRADKVIAARDRSRAKGNTRPVRLKTPLNLRMTKEETSLQGTNVLGYIEGADPDLRDELVVLTAHYDHLGMRGDAIYYGADDNASGTSTLLEVCEAFAAARKEGAGPRRSVLVMLVSGEEKGLLGSEYYVSNPVFPLEQTVANINVDMVGRVDEKHQDNPNYIYVIGADRLSTELHEINERMNATYTQLELDYTYNREDDPNRYYYRSDHYNFASNGIPAVFYFNGTHDDYHRTSDTVDKINFEKMEKIGRLVFHTAWELANRDERIKVDVNAEGTN